MHKEIHLNNTVYEISQKSPEVLEIMKELGFDNITDPGMLNTVGRFMTLPKGAKMKNINLEIIKKAFEEKGYTVIE
jgi:Domain of unknown function (DUF1858).